MIRLKHRRGNEPLTGIAGFCASPLDDGTRQEASAVQDDNPRAGLAKPELGREPTFKNFELGAANPSRADVIDWVQAPDPADEIKSVRDMNNYQVVDENLGKVYVDPSASHPLLVILLPSAAVRLTVDGNHVPFLNTGLDIASGRRTISENGFGYPPWYRRWMILLKAK